jgi:hypothetical protein
MITSGLVPVINGGSDEPPEGSDVVESGENAVLVLVIEDVEVGWDGVSVETGGMVDVSDEVPVEIASAVKLVVEVVVVAADSQADILISQA